MSEESVESDDFKQKSKKYKTAIYLNAMNENDKELNHKIIRNMNKRINFLKNPRYVVKEPTITIKSIREKPVSYQYFLYLTKKKINKGNFANSQSFRQSFQSNSQRSGFH